VRRLFLDANVLFSAAHKQDSAQGLLIDFAQKHLIKAISSAYAFDEAHRNLVRKSPNALVYWPAISSAIGLAPIPDREHLVWAEGQVVAKDAPILASAVIARVDWLVTGDRRDFGHLFSTTQRGVLIMTPSEAVRRLLLELEDTSGKLD
jgi:uncharacterized protein